MPGLIHSDDYGRAKTSLVGSMSGADEAVEALEWSLLNTPLADLQNFPIVQVHDATSSDRPYRSIMTAATRGRPSLVAVFTTELFDGEDKVLLLDVWANLDGEDEEETESEEG